MEKQKNWSHWEILTDKEQWENREKREILAGIGEDEEAIGAFTEKVTF